MIIGDNYFTSRVMIANSILQADLGFRAGVGGRQVQMNGANVVSSTISCAAILALGGGSTCEGVIAEDPGFRNPAAGDFRLLASSPAVDAGPGPYDPWGEVATHARLYPWLYARHLDDMLLDRDGMPRIVNGRIDIGAYELQNP